MTQPAREMPVTIADLAEGKAYLAQLNLANPVVADRQLLRLLDGLLIAPPAGLFEILEEARAPILYVEEEVARRFHNRPLPLSNDEEDCFDTVVATWQKLAKAYALCARLAVPNISDEIYKARVATILHRCIHYTSMAVLEHFRARRELPAGIWLDLHGYFETAEEWGVALTPINDVQHHEVASTHCQAAYVAILLIDLASPYSNSIRNLNLIRQWADLWASQVEVRPITGDAPPAYLVELMQDMGVHAYRSETPFGRDARMLDTSRIALQMAYMLGQLRDRFSPSQLGLGEETSGHVIGLLEQLARPWSLAAAPRRYRRFAAEGLAQVASGFEAMHFCVTACEFEQPNSAATYSRGDFDTLFTFRDQVDTARELIIKPKVSFPVEEWTVINHSANGFRLTRGGSGERLNHGQLLVLRPHDGDHFLLSQINWLMQEASGGMVVGVSILPGLPLGIGVRLLAAGGSERFVRAFELPAVAAVRSDASLILPSGMYVAGRTLEIHTSADDEIRKVRMNHLLQRGADFEQISFQPV